MDERKRMTVSERNKCLACIQERYWRADRAEKGRLLTHLEQMTGLRRKTLITKLRGDLMRRARRKQRGRRYGAAVDDALRVISDTYDHISAERLTPDLVEMAECLERFGELRVTPDLLSQLAEVSVATVGRILRRIRQDEPRLPRAGPQQASRARRAIPMGRIARDVSSPGYLETDLVHHCGNHTGGEYVHTIQMIDVLTGWSERRAVLGRSYLVVQDALRHIAKRVPFPIHEIHPDNGSEFLGDHMLRFWPALFPGASLSRTRPWHKNDNPFVEQKNNTLVRRYFGDQRFDTVAQTRALNQLYDAMWTYYNFFQPVMRLKEKSVVTDSQGHTRIRRHFDRAQTPLARLCASGALSPDQQAHWRAYRETINPRQLHRTIYQLIDRLSRLPGATPGIVEDVRETVANPD
jgi:hypothetical protein